jgi:hypothetical protein
VPEVTVTPLRASPVFESDILPEMVRFCAQTCEEQVKMHSKSLKSRLQIK